jgi:hypothetical protein
MMDVMKKTAMSVVIWLGIIITVLPFMWPYISDYMWVIMGNRALFCTISTLGILVIVAGWYKERNGG